MAILMAQHSREGGCCRGPASLTLGPARTTRCSLRAGAEYLEGIPNRSFDPGAAPAKSQHRNHLRHDLVVSAQLLIGGQPPDQSHEIRRAVLCDGGSQWNRAQCGAVKAKTEIPALMMLVLVASTCTIAKDKAPAGNQAYQHATYQGLHTYVAYSSTRLLTCLGNL